MAETTLPSPEIALPSDERGIIAGLILDIGKDIRRAQRHISIPADEVGNRLVVEGFKGLLVAIPYPGRNVTVGIWGEEEADLLLERKWHPENHVLLSIAPGHFASQVGEEIPAESGLIVGIRIPETLTIEVSDLHGLLLAGEHRGDLVLRGDHHARVGALAVHSLSATMSEASGLKIWDVAETATCEMFDQAWAAVGTGRVEGSILDQARVTLEGSVHDHAKLSLEGNAHDGLEAVKVHDQGGVRWQEAGITKGEWRGTAVKDWRVIDH